MDAKTYRIRGFGPRDYDAEARVLARVDPTTATTGAEIQRLERTFFVPPLVLHKIVAEVPPDGRAVGFGALRSDPESFDPRAHWIDVVVDPDHRGRGIGRAMAEELDLEAAALGSTREWAGVFADDGSSVRFFRAQRFEERRRGWRSRLDLTMVSPVPDRSQSFVRDGISFLTASQLDLSDDSVVRSLYTLNDEASRDEPRLGSFTSSTVEQFVQSEISGPTFMPEAFFLAREGARFVGVSALRRVPADPTRLHQSFTGVARDRRGRGIATELKRLGAEFARARGYRWITTRNDSLNQAMLAINRKLGFVLERERIYGERRRASE